MSEIKDIIPIDNINEDMSSDNGKTTSFFKKPSTVFIIILILAWATTYLFMNFTHSSEIKSMKRNAAEKMYELETNWLKQSVIPLVWAIRSEMLRNNKENIDKYQNDFVKFPGVRNIMIVDNDGTIIISTDRKYVDKKFTSEFDAGFLSHNDFYIIADKDKSLIKASNPILGIDRRLGTLFLTYTIEEGKYDISR